MTGGSPVYDLLPAIHRIRDTERGGPLEALLGIVEEEWRRLVDDVDGMYDDWFIETCDEWVVPYIADLLGVQGLSSVVGGGLSRRALVANTLAYRRRKGTPAVLEQVARDATGWPARVVEYFQLLGTTQHLDHIRPANVRTPDLRDSAPLELIGTPFDRTAHTVDVRHIDTGRGRHGIPHVGLHLWRLGAYAVAGADARAVDQDLGQWTFDPAGRDVPLFNRPRTEPALTHLAEEVDVPGQLRRRALHDELTALRTDPDATPVFFAEPTPALRVQVDGRPVDPRSLICADLSTWSRPAAGGTVAVDPVLGRLTLPPGVPPRRVLVDYAYGFPGDLGAGPYERRATLADGLTVAGRPWPDQATWQHEGGWQVGVGRDLEPVPGRIVRTIGDAVRLWNARPRRAGGQVGIIAVTDSATYTEDVSIEVEAGDRLLLVAAYWPERESPDVPGMRARRPGSFVASRVWPHLIGSIHVTGTGSDEESPCGFVLSGFSVEGGLTVARGNLGSLVVTNCTFLAAQREYGPDGGVVDATDDPRLTVRLLRTICAQVRLTGVPGLGLTDCIVHADCELDAPAVDAASAHVEVQACTILGRTRARSLAGSDSILRGLVDVQVRQQGCLRFSYLPLESRSPRRYRCQPVDLAGASRIAPTFTSVQPADPALGQLAADCPPEILTGAEDEGEMGAFGFLGQHRRKANLTSQLDTYLRFGLEAGLFFRT
ncbi:hypothetical protein GCM10027451_16010 [Geodermatophilus aquaeductus]|uniref:Phage tail protein (Tail_P2_I) n=1 Tax=Geodermatophilus aquaeductus TaxID=1564161 RepID=A0A521E0P3_9ACTN|nr:phage tail protein [Geodermatophilus aquaeductus]SMO76700.1 Phage tail protein (Tail_P2_I) [Geodermatophilus aquaeductus]